MGIGRGFGVGDSRRLFRWIVGGGDGLSAGDCGRDAGAGVCSLRAARIDFVLVDIRNRMVACHNRFSRQLFYGRAAAAIAIAGDLHPSDCVRSRGGGSVAGVAGGVEPPGIPPEL